MKKFLNKSLFYQGDKSILIPLLCTYLVAYFGIRISFHSFTITLYDNLYRVGDNIYVTFPYSGPMVFGSALYIITIFVIISGFFKRKKWTTLLSGPFSKNDIRKREAMIMGLSILVFIALFLLISIEGFIVNKDVIYYFGDYIKIIALDFVRITVVLLAFTGYLFFIDSLFTNIFVTIVGGIVPPIFIIVTIKWISYITNYKNPLYNGIMYFFDRVFDYLFNMNVLYFSNKTYIVITILFATLFIVLSYLSKKLVKGIRVEKFTSLTLYKGFSKIFINFVAVTVSMFFVPEITNIILYNTGKIPYQTSFLIKFTISLVALVLLVSIINAIIKVIKVSVKKSNLI